MIDDSLTLTAMVFSRRTKGNSTISDQLDAGLIIVRAVKSNIVPSWGKLYVALLKSYISYFWQI